jgi:hypothetical protein
MTNIVQIDSSSSSDKAIHQLMNIVSEIRSGKVVGLSVIKITDDLEVVTSSLLEVKHSYRSKTA